MSSSLTRAINDIKAICEKSEGRSRIFAYGSSGYKDSVRHFLESSSEVAQVAVCPGTAEDVSQIMKVLARRRVPFGIKGGGHATNPKFSSTTGIQLYMSFDKVKYRSSDKTLSVGSGCLWDQVYREILTQKRYVIGGSAREGVGVAGWLLGGGYSLYSNQYGLGIDNIVEFEVVLPSGDIVRAKSTGRYSDLFEALKGGGNNFGIVTQFVLKTYRIQPPSSRLLNFCNAKSEKVKGAITNFINAEETQKAVLVAAFRYYNEIGKDQSLITVLCVRDGSENILDPFREFESIPQQSRRETNRQNARNAPRLLKNAAGASSSGGSEDANGFSDVFVFNTDSEDAINELELDFFETDELFDSIYAPPLPIDQKDTDTAAITASEVVLDYARTLTEPAPEAGMSGVGEIARGRFGCIMVSKYNQNLINAIDKQAKESATNMKENGGKRVVFEIWPAHSGIFDNSTPSAYPHKKGSPFGPMVVYCVWEGANNDHYWVNEMQRALHNLYHIALTEGCTNDRLPFYSNTSLDSTKVSEIYRENYGNLRRVRLKYDPQDVMKHAGGFRIRLPRTRQSFGVAPKSSNPNVNGERSYVQYG
ncbi:hypothetical protein FRC19_007956 [Serendipita sp. 401]|nr:hypothetical protein FRC15_009765 [Serendipita sp. 397]KAG8826722.1 hypothetical protein FRC19_007956 [Serendipita sp. 401]KAG8865990.1 hypothetical protein FRC20_009185 [Serendipita sp. 405]